MKKVFLAVFGLWAALAFAEKSSSLQIAANGGAVPRKYYDRIAMRFVNSLERFHVLQRPFDDEISQKAWTNLVTFYDYDHSVFLQDDLNEFAQRGNRLDDELKVGNVSFGYDVHRKYVKRLNERIDFMTNRLIQAQWDFTIDEDYDLKRDKAEWPRTREEAENLWLRQLKNEVLVSILARELDEEDQTNGFKKVVANKSAATNKVESVEAMLIKKYRQFAAIRTEPDEEMVLQQYLSAVAHAYDPHSDYFSPASKEDFDMDMNLTLCGVGAVLQMEDGALKVIEVMPGGPVDRDGRIREGDKIVGVKQGDGEIEDIMWRPMNKTIRKIRGKKGTKVTLEIVPVDATMGMPHEFIELVRDEIKLEDQAATGRVERVVSGGVTNRLGYVCLPGFYESMDKRPDDEGYRSCAADTAAYLADFNAMDVEGMILDLRGDGGGSLREAIRLSALFAPSAPVVLVRDIRNTIPLAIPAGQSVAFTKPLVVLVDRASASASEIVAGFLKDSGRAIVIGDRTTHGKGTVQTVMGMGPSKYGSIKLTTARFYRINGMSTQMMGVKADIHLPSLLDSLDIGEDKLNNALPFTSVKPFDFVPCWDLPKYLPQLCAASEVRLKENERYLRHLRSVTSMREQFDRNKVSLERAKRKAMMRSDRAARELNDDEDAQFARRRRGPKQDDVVLDEAFRILADLVRLNNGAVLPTSSAELYGTILGL